MTAVQVLEQKLLHKVLIVDDEPFVAESIADLLEDDFDVFTAASGEDALTILEEETISVILSDQRMPGLTGDEFLAKARERSTATRMLITGYADLQALVQAVNHGQIYGYIAKPWDPLELTITVRKAADHYELVQSLEHERNLLYALMDNIPDAIYFKDARHRYTRINHACARFLNAGEPQDAVGKTARDFISERAADVVRAQEEEILQTGRPILDNVQEIQTPNAPIQWTSSTKVPLHDRNNKITGLVGITRDITERKQAELALQESEIRLRGLIQHLPDGVCLLDGNRTLLLVNPAAEEHLRLLAENAGPGQRLDTLADHPLDTFFTPREDSLPHEITHPNGTERTFEIDGRPLSEDAPHTGWVLVIRDVTTERETRERVQQQYRLASVGQLAAGIAHDFNNLLTVMMGCAQLLEMGSDLPDKVREDLRLIVTQGQRAAQLVRQILDFSRKSVAERQPLNLVPSLKEAAKLLERTLPETIRIDLRCPDDDCTVEANPTQLQQIITNLAVNARDAMPDGGTLTLELSHFTLGSGDRPPLPEMEPGEWVAWRFADTGTGIPPQVLRHIFEPFYTTKPPGKGTGLGLAQIYGIVKQYDGYIDVHTEEGKGTAFILYLPRIASGTDTGETGMVMPRGQGETILLVEDQEGVRRIAQNILEHLNYRALLAADGQEALALFEEHRENIALVLSDMVMPNLNGLELARSLKNINPETPIVIMTGYAPGEKVGQQELSRIDGWLEKPVTLDNVAYVLNRILHPSPER